jgi:hypothetical protein
MTRMENRHAETSIRSPASLSKSRPGAADMHLFRMSVIRRRHGSSPPVGSPTVLGAGRLDPPFGSMIAGIIIQCLRHPRWSPPGQGAGARGRRLLLMTLFWLPRLTTLAVLPEFSTVIVSRFD